MNTGFRAACREQAGLAFHALGSFLGRFAPKSTKGAVGNAGCLLLFPFITLLVWSIQAIIWVIIAIPILAYALVMALLGGGFTRAPVDPLPRPQRSRVRTAEDDARPYVGRDGGM